MAEAGIVGMGGATFPSAVKLNLRAKYDLHTLVINGAECEPYLTCDDRLMRERAEEIADGVGIMARALGVTQIVVAIESNKAEAISAMQRFDRALDIPLRVQVVPTQYPMGSEKHLVKILTGRETPARALTADLASSSTMPPPPMPSISRCATASLSCRAWSRSRAGRCGGLPMCAS